MSLLHFDTGESNLGSRAFRPLEIYIHFKLFDFNLVQITYITPLEMCDMCAKSNYMYKL